MPDYSTPSLKKMSCSLCRFPNDSEHFANVGLPNVVAALKELKKKWGCITFADLSAFLGPVVIEAAGGEYVQEGTGAQL